MLKSCCSFTYTVDKINIFRCYWKIADSRFIYYDKWKKFIWINFDQNQKMSPKNMDSFKENEIMFQCRDAHPLVLLQDPHMFLPLVSHQVLLLGHLYPTHPVIKATHFHPNSFPNYFNAIYPHLSLGIPTSVPVVPLRFNTSNPTPPCKRIR